MADRKVSQLTGHTAPVAEDLLLIVDDPNGSPVSKKITLKTLFANAPNTAISGFLSTSGNNSFTGSNTYFSSNVVVTGTSRLTNLVVPSNKITITTAKTPSTNNATTEFGSPTTDRPWNGTIFWDTNYLYVAVSNTVIKRVALSAFT
jgi:hypothetical protein